MLQISFFYIEHPEIESEKAQLLDLYHQIEEQEGQKRLENDFGNWWEGNFVDRFQIGKPGSINCRGSIEYMDELEPDYFQIYQEDAWGPNVELWEKILQTHYSAVSLVYEAEEPGFGLYVNTDITGRFLSDRYLVEFDYEVSDETYNYCETEEEALETVNDILKTAYQTLSEAEEKERGKNRVYIHKFEDH